MRKVIFALSLLAGSLVGTSSQAAVQLTLFAPNNSTALIADNGADDSDSTTGSIVVISKTVGAYTFSVSAMASSTTGNLTLSNASVSTITGTVAGKVGILASTNNAPTLNRNLNVSSNASVAYGSAGAKSTAAVSYASYVDTTNALSTVTYVGGVVTAAPGGTLVDSGSGTISTPFGGSTDSWVDSGTQTVTNSASPVAMNLLVMADLSVGTGSGPTNHQVQMNGSIRLSPVPEPASLAIWALGGLVGLAARRRYC